MVLPLIVQTVGTATTTAAPASITGTYAATTAGNLLVAVVAVAPSGAPAVATPASWATGSAQTSANLGLFTFNFQNNTGGITTVVFNLTNANGAAVVMYEVSGIETARAADIHVLTSATSSATVNTAQANPALSDEVAVGASAWITAATLTSAVVPSPNFWTAAGLQTSTTGATNVALQAYVATPGTTNLLSIGGTLSGAQFNASALMTFVSTSSQTVVWGPVQGVMGIMASGVGFPGSIGGI